MPADLESLADEAEVALAQALEQEGFALVEAPPGADLAIAIGDGKTVAVEVKTLSHAGPGRVRSLLARDRVSARSTAVPVLVADAVTAGSRKLLDEAGWGWFDRRGHLRLRAPGLVVQAQVPPAERNATPSGARPIRGRADVAIALRSLMAPDGPIEVRATAKAAGLAPSSISRALRRLQDVEHLVGRDGRPLLPDLFWALADEWDRPSWSLKRRPDPQPGWVLSGTRAAVAWGAPLTATDAYPLELYVPSDADARLARQQWGEAASATGVAARVRSAPVPLVTEARTEVAVEGWSLAHPVVVALDLAGDLARGVEVLEGWEPPTPFRRVW